MVLQKTAEEGVVEAGLGRENVEGSRTGGATTKRASSKAKEKGHRTYVLQVVEEAKEAERRRQKVLQRLLRGMREEGGESETKNRARRKRRHREEVERRFAKERQADQLRIQRLRDDADVLIKALKDREQEQHGQARHNTEDGGNEGRVVDIAGWKKQRQAEADLVTPGKVIFMKQVFDMLDPLSETKKTVGQGEKVKRQRASSQQLTRGLAQSMKCPPFESSGRRVQLLQEQRALLTQLQTVMGRQHEAILEDGGGRHPQSRRTQYGLCSSDRTRRSLPSLPSMGMRTGRSSRCGPSSLSSPGGRSTRSSLTRTSSSSDASMASYASSAHCSSRGAVRHRHPAAVPPLW